MLNGMTIDELVGEVTVVQMSPNECGIRDDMDSEHIKIVGRRKAMQFVFEHLASGGICITQKMTVKGRTGTVIHLWTLKQDGPIIRKVSAPTTRAESE